MMESGFRSLAQGIIVMGVLLLVLGSALYLLGSRPLNWPKLPGDIVIDWPGFRLVLPLGTSFLLSIVLSLILWGVRRFLDR